MHVFVLLTYSIHILIHHTLFYIYPPTVAEASGQYRRCIPHTRRDTAHLVLSRAAVYTLG